MKGHTAEGGIPEGFPTGGVYTYIAFDRNGISDPVNEMTYEKVATYSSAKGKTLLSGSTVN